MTIDLDSIKRRIDRTPTGPYWCSGTDIFISTEPPPHREVSTLAWTPEHQADWKRWEEVSIGIVTEHEDMPGFSLEENGIGHMFAHAREDIIALIAEVERLRAGQ